MKTVGQIVRGAADMLGITPDEVLRRVRVNAAAPAMLSALISVEQAYSNKHSPQHRAACLAEARAAIAKATGETA